MKLKQSSLLNAIPTAPSIPESPLMSRKQAKSDYAMSTVLISRRDGTRDGSTQPHHERKEDGCRVTGPGEIGKTCHGVRVTLKAPAQKMVSKFARGDDEIPRKGRGDGNKQHSHSCRPDER